MLARGYVIVQDEAGRVVKAVAAAPADSAIRVLLARGRLKTRVTESGE